MSMTGGMSFFDKSRCLYKDGARAVSSSNNDDVNYILSMNRIYRWESVGSDDVTTETITITFLSPRIINRIWLGEHNLKDFSITYNTGADFTNVVGLNGSSSGISESNNIYDASYYEFDAVSVSTLEITANTTLEVDAEKFIALVVATTEIGTLTGYPDVKDIAFDRNESDQTVLSGVSHIVKSGEVASLKIDMRSYPVQGDVDLIHGLFDREDPFLLWPNGGMPDQFRIKQKGWRIQDIYQMQTKGKTGSGYSNNVYINGAEKKLSLVEVV